MANGKIRFGKQSGGELSLIITDGVGNTEVIVPESGELATKEYADTKLSKPELISVTGSATFDGPTQKITITNIGNITLALGDVIEVSGTISNNKLFTVESIVDDNNIVVNYEHRGTSTPAPSKRLVNETASNCTIKLYNRAKNAPLGQGQGLVNVTSSRVKDQTYYAPYDRNIGVYIIVARNISTGGFSLITDNQAFDITHNGSQSHTENVTITMPIQNKNSYILQNSPVGGQVKTWLEMR